MLGKLHDYDEQSSSDLVKSLACFLEANGHWGEAAERLYVHRHTLRYRMKRVEEISGRDLGSSQDRMEFWLALKAKELIEQSGKKTEAGARLSVRRPRRPSGDARLASSAATSPRRRPGWSRSRTRSRAEAHRGGDRGRVAAPSERRALAGAGGALA